ncbi:MAG: class B sortase [Clostridia bacterium]|nr:class B sortase [Clostridia bacterium]
MKKYVYYIIAAVAVVCIAAALIFTNPFNIGKTPVEPTTVATTVPTTQKPTYVIEGTDHEDFDVLKKKYKDIVGYISISDTNIDDVVVQAEDNDYYLRRSPSGSYRFAGSYFADYRCDMVNLSQNTTIYGHNLRDTSRLFGQLNKYKKLDFYKQSPYIKFDTLDKKAQWKIFAVFITNVKGEDGVIFNYREPDYETDEEFLHFIERCKRRSYIDCPVDIRADDKILTLSTCDYEIDNDWRLVVMGRLVREGEDPSVDVSKASVNENQLFPEGWYKRKGGTRPVYADEPTLK